MKLHYSRRSPYVRKVMIVSIETGLRERIETVTRPLSPVDPNDEINATNPIGKIPALIADDGMVLYDSPVICEYLDSLHDGPKMFPLAGPARWTALRRQAVGDGILDAGITVRYETKLRPESLRWADWTNGQLDKMTRALDALEHEAASLGEAIDVGIIAIGCALGYMDFRFPDLAWRDSRPTLAAWFEGFAVRPSFVQTMPPPK